MADYNLKTFVYDTRGYDSQEDIDDRIDADVSAYLTAQSATNFDHMAVASNDQYVVVSVLWNDAI